MASYLADPEINLAHPAYGVDLTGTVDSTAGVQQWLDDLKAATGPNGAPGIRGVLPAYATVRVGGTLTLNSVNGLTISGPGPSAFTFLWVSASGTVPLWQLNGCNRCLFEGFYIKSSAGTGLLDTAFRIDRLAGVPPVSQGNIFRRVIVEGTNAGGLNRGFHFSSANGDSNNDFHVLDEVTVYNYSAEGVLIQGTQGYGHQLLDTHLIAASATGQYAVRCEQGMFQMRGGLVGGNTVADFSIGVPQGNVVIENMISEGSKRFLVTAAAYSGAGRPIRIVSNRWSSDALHSDGKMIIYQHSGPLVMINNELGEWGVTGAVIPKVEVNPGDDGFGFISHGNRWVGNADVLAHSPYILPSQVSGTKAARVSIEGDVFADEVTSTLQPRAFANGATTPAVHTGRQFYVENTAATQITNLTEGYPTQRVLIINNTTNSNTTIKHNANASPGYILLRAAADKTLGAYQTIELVFTGVAWLEV